MACLCQRYCILWAAATENSKSTWQMYSCYFNQRLSALHIDLLRKRCGLSMGAVKSWGYLFKWCTPPTNAPVAGCLSVRVTEWIAAKKEVIRWFSACTLSSSWIFKPHPFSLGRATLSVVWVTALQLTLGREYKNMQMSLRYRVLHGPSRKWRHDNSSCKQHVVHKPEHW